MDRDASSPIIDMIKQKKVFQPDPAYKGWIMNAYLIGEAFLARLRWDASVHHLSGHHSALRPVPLSSVVHCFSIANRFDGHGDFRNRSSNNLLLPVRLSMYTRLQKVGDDAERRMLGMESELLTTRHYEHPDGFLHSSYALADHLGPAHLEKPQGHPNWDLPYWWLVSSPPPSLPFLLLLVMLPKLLTEPQSMRWSHCSSSHFTLPLRIGNAAS